MEERARRKDTGSHGAAAVPRGSHGTACTPQALYRHFQADCLGVDRGGVRITAVPGRSGRGEGRAQFAEGLREGGIRCG